PMRFLFSRRTEEGVSPLALAFAQSWGGATGGLKLKELWLDAVSSGAAPNRKSPKQPTPHPTAPAPMLESREFHRRQMWKCEYSNKRALDSSHRRVPPPLRLDYHHCYP